MLQHRSHACRPSDMRKMLPQLVQCGFRQFSIEVHPAMQCRTIDFSNPPEFAICDRW